MAPRFDGSGGVFMAYCSNASDRLGIGVEANIWGIVALTQGACMNIERISLLDDIFLVDGDDGRGLSKRLPVDGDDGCVLTELIGVPCNDVG